ncbi:hypothetical protein GC207_14610 [bacterium]|nr:hypothetical protein [bacterium]
MRTLLHIKSDTADARAESVISQQLARDELAVEICDLNIDQPDYESLLDKILAADSVAVW